MRKSSFCFYRRHKAFTLVELMVVAGIIAVLSSVTLAVVFRARRQQANLRLETCKANMRKISDSLESLKAADGFYPIYLGQQGGYGLGNVGTKGFTWPNGMPCPMVRCPNDTRKLGYCVTLYPQRYVIYCHSDHSDAGYEPRYPRYAHSQNEPAPRWYNNAAAVSAEGSSYSWIKSSSVSY